VDDELSGIRMALEGSTAASRGTQQGDLAPDRSPGSGIIWSPNDLAPNDRGVPNGRWPTPQSEVLGVEGGYGPLWYKKRGRKGYKQTLLFWKVLIAWLLTSGRVISLRV